MRIAIIGWGSLIWDPGVLEIEGKWQENGPLLPVEFARFSGGGRLTLVLLGNAPPQRTLWVLSRKGSLDAARRDLRARERTSLRDIGACLRVDGDTGHYLGDDIIRKWLLATGLDAAVWTALKPNRSDRSPGVSPEEERVAWLKALIARGEERDAREYIVRAPGQIATPLRQRIREELGWG
jgi:hypothetical protein